MEDELVTRNPYVGAPMARYVGEFALEKGVNREDQDAWALRSHQCWGAASQAGKLLDLATILGCLMICGEPRESAALPGLAIKKLLNQLNLILDQIKLIEINKAFAAMPLISSLVLGKIRHIWGWMPLKS